MIQLQDLSGATTVFGSLKKSGQQRDKCIIKGKTPMKEIIIMMVIVGVWFLLQAYILPKLGVST